MSRPLRLDSVTMGNREVSEGQACYVVAEIGINHNGDMALARETIAAASKAGADAVKFQNYQTEDFITDHSLTYSYISQGHPVEECQYDMFKRYELQRNALARLKADCDEYGVDFISTPTSSDGVADLVAVGATALKNGSDCLGHLPLIRHMARTGLPTILSTGMASPTDIDAAVDAFRESGGEKLVLLHCVSIYPTPMLELNLRKIPTLARKYGCPVGFSDHSEGILAAVAARALGACVLEKHFTLDRTLPGPDHAMSSDPDELKDLVRAVRAAEAALGRPDLVPSGGEEATRLLCRLSCVAASDLKQGHRLRGADIAYHRPGTGLEPSKADLLVDRVLRIDVSRGHIFAWSDLTGTRQ